MTKLILSFFPTQCCSSPFPVISDLCISMMEETTSFAIWHCEWSRKCRVGLSNTTNYGTASVVCIPPGYMAMWKSRADTVQHSSKGRRAPYRPDHSPLYRELSESYLSWAMKLDGTIEPLNNQTIFTHHRRCRRHQFFGWLSVASLACCPIVLAGCKINTTMSCLTPLLLSCESLSCMSSLTLAGCWIAALVTHRPQCPVLAILELRRQRSTQAQLIVVCASIYQWVGALQHRQ
jgi:hypothetical protein